MHVLVALILFVYGARALATFDDDDLITYRTLPKHRVSKWKITDHDRQAVAPGYWFVAPYFNKMGEPRTNRWMPCQIGPYIFDQDGELVWAGSCEFDNRNVWDFRIANITGQSPHLAFILQKEYGVGDDKNSAIIFDNSYKTKYIIPGPEDDFDRHELNPYAPDKALALVHRREQKTLANKENPQSVVVGGFVEFEIASGDVLKEWNAGDRIALEESYLVDPATDSVDPDFMHVNAIDKNENGDFLLSARHTDTVYLISGEDGDIIWRLGGKKNDFEMDFQFSRQHNSKFISVNATHMVLSLFDNGADLITTNEPTSSAIYIELDLQAMKARLLKRYMRPDGQSTRRRGNMQTLPNGNVLVCWATEGYMSEFNKDGDLLMEAKFASDRFSTYRAYKFPWWSRPADPPTIVASGYGVNGSLLSTAFYVSWNGATDVKYWRFYAQPSSSGQRVELETIPKKGFETSYIAPGYMDWVSVEALDEKHQVMGTSPVTRSTPPEYWPEGARMPHPDNPAYPAIFNMTYVERITSPAPTAGLSFVGFIAGALTSAAAVCTIFYYPAIRRYFVRTCSKAHPDDSEEALPLNTGEL